MDELNNVQTAEGQPQAESLTAEQTPSGSTSSEDVKIPETSEEPTGDSEETGEDKGENKIPHSRVKEMVTKAREDAAKEILDSLKKENKISALENTSGAEQDDIKKAEEYIRTLVRSELEPIKAKTELAEALTLYPDMAQYKDSMIKKLKENASLSFIDAYKIAKFDDSIEESKEAGKKEAYQNMQKKKQASIEGVKQVGTKKKEIDGGFNVFDKSLPLKKVEEMIKKISEQS